MNTLYLIIGMFCELFTAVVCVYLLVCLFSTKENYREKYFKILRDYKLLGIEFNRSEELIKVLRRLCDEKDRDINKLKNS